MERDVVRLWVLGSGSKGNAVLLECGDSRVLIDAGFPARVLGDRLGEIGVAPASIEACVLTHEHSDHVRGAAVAARRWGWALHATAGTLAACPDLQTAGVTTLAAGETRTFSRLSIEAVATSHDAAESIAVVATARGSGVRAGVLYDLGVVTDGVRKRFHDLDILLLESNHDERMLRSGPYPRVVQDRIASRHGHLSNVAAAALARDCAHASLNHVVLAHISENCNDHGLARTVVGTTLARTRFRGKVSVAPQHGIAGPFAPRLSRTAPAVEQLALAL